MTSKSTWHFSNDRKSSLFSIFSDDGSENDPPSTPLKRRARLPSTPVYPVTRHTSQNIRPTTSRALYAHATPPNNVVTPLFFPDPLPPPRLPRPRVPSPRRHAPDVMSTMLISPPKRHPKPVSVQDRVAPSALLLAQLNDIMETSHGALKGIRPFKMPKDYPQVKPERLTHGALKWPTHFVPEFVQPWAAPSAAGDLAFSPNSSPRPLVSFGGYAPIVIPFPPASGNCPVGVSFRDLQRSSSGRSVLISATRTIDKDVTSGILRTARASIVVEWTGYAVTHREGIDLRAEANSLITRIEFGKAAARAVQNFIDLWAEEYIGVTDALYASSSAQPTSMSLSRRHARIRYEHLRLVEAISFDGREFYLRMAVVF
ncbi:hypothetical protein C8R43DRAFT_964509 [Mycena crocata]|nr:hypothetical protein C8R43DRAFT_964509 [Mycena crocata]